MSHRTIDENLRYFVFNQGADINLPVLNICQDPSQKTTTVVTAGGNWNFNGTAPQISGTSIFPLASSSSIAAVTIGTTSQLQALYPKFVSYSVALNYAGSSALTDVDWASKATGSDTFPTAPSPGTAASFVVPVVGTTTQWQFPTGGLFDVEVQWTFGGNLTATNQALIQISESANSGGSFVLVAQASASPPTSGINMTTMSLYHAGLYVSNNTSRMKVTVASMLTFASSNVGIKFIKRTP